MNVLSLPNERSRLLQDLEFLQMLGNADYLVWLSKMGFTEDPLFINYLLHLQYLSNSDFSHLVLFPDSLRVVTLLLDERFRAVLGADPDLFKTVLKGELLASWAHSSGANFSDI